MTDDEYRAAAKAIIDRDNATGSSRHWFNEAAEVKRNTGGAWVEAWVWVADTPQGSTH